MADIDYAKREVTCKLVYYGPGRSGKTTNLEVIHVKAPADSKGDLVTITAETNRSLRFDFLPLRLGTVRGMKTVMQLYSVPGQVSYNATRRHVLRGADGVVFLEVPIVFQWNKRDLPDAMPVEEMNADLNRWGAPACEGVAIKGEVVFPTMKMIAALVMPEAKR